MSRPRRLATALSALLVALGVAGCGSPEREAVNELRAALERTSRVAHRFSYEEIAHGGGKIEVQGLVEDDLRRQAYVRVDGKPVLEEVVHDDRLLVRFLEPSFIPQLVRKETPPTPGDRPEGEISGPELGRALAEGRWIADDAGAPSILSADASERHPLGEDPVYDATTVFDYVRRVIRTMPVREFNPDALDYRPREDPFPKPAEGSGVTRYDVVRSPVPRPSDTGGGNQAIPSEVNFRKLSVYVKDGLVVQVLEDIDVAGRLDDVKRNYDLDLEGSLDEQVTQAVDAINVVRKGQGQLDPLRVRRMSFRLEGHRDALRVRVPDVDVKANLAFLLNRGKVTAARTAPGAGGETSEPAVPIPTTTPASAPSG